jgi:hypothetical protein
MFVDIRQFIGRCHVCLANKRSQRKQNPPLQAFSTEAAPFQAIHIDLIGPLNTTPRRHKFVLVMVDRATRYVVTAPLRSKTKEEVVKAFNDKFLCVFGQPASVFSDRGTEFLNCAMKDLCEELGVKQIVTSGYHPNSNGLAERAVQSIIGLFRTLLKDKGTDWDMFLPHVTFQLNTSRNSTTQYSPFFLTHGFNPKTSQLLHQIQDAQLDGQDAAALICANRKSARSAVENNIANNQALYKMYGDRGRKDSQIQTGDLVYIYTPQVNTLQCKGKFLPAFQGPFQVTHLSALSQATLRNPSTGQLRPHPLHVSRLKRAAQLRLSDVPTHSNTDQQG